MEPGRIPMAVNIKFRLSLCPPAAAISSLGATTAKALESEEAITLRLGSAARAAALCLTKLSRMDHLTECGAVTEAIRLELKELRRNKKRPQMNMDLHR